VLLQIWLLDDLKQYILNCAIYWHWMDSVALLRAEGDVDNTKELLGHQRAL